MKEIVPLIVLLLIPIFSPLVQAVGYERECLDNTTMQTTIRREVCDEDGCYNMTITESTNCEYGCIEGDIEGTAKCKTAPWLVTLLILLVVLGLASLGYYMLG